PWAPAANNAAEALVELGDKIVIPHLVQLLSQPDPSAPQTLPNGKVVVKEVVRVNHLTNCLMCHPPSYDGTGPALGVDPVLNLTRVIPTTSVTSFQIGRASCREGW